MEGDSYRYARSEQPGAALPLDEPTVTIDGLSPGQRQCVQVYTYRSGALSAPLEICSGE